MATASSDLVMQMFGSIAGAESLLLGFAMTRATPSAVMAEAPHGTAPRLDGKNVANPMAMILAGGRCSPTSRTARAQAGLARDLRCGVRGGRRWRRTADLGGHATHDRVHRRGDRAFNLTVSW